MDFRYRSRAHAHVLRMVEDRALSADRFDHRKGQRGESHEVMPAGKP